MNRRTRRRHSRDCPLLSPGVARFGDEWMCPHGIVYRFGPGGVGGAGAWFAEPPPKRWRWMLPRFNIYTPANRQPRLLWNHYPSGTIGAAVVAFGRCWGVRWKR